MNNRAAGIRFCNISVIRSEKIILDGISCLVPPGSSNVMIGPNGAGKTTLLRCLLHEISFKGQIEFFNSAGDAVSPNIGHVPQIVQPDANMPLKVYEFLTLAQTSMPLWLGCPGDKRKKCRSLLELVEAEHLENQRLGEISGGEMRRVLLASALSRQPDLLILDEAEAGVDYKGERLFWRLLENMRREFGFTLVMVSHNLSLAAHYADNILCLKGKLLAQGPPEKAMTSSILQELFGIPIHLYPRQCEESWPHCPDCGAMGFLPHPDSDFSDKNSLQRIKNDC